MKIEESKDICCDSWEITRADDKLYHFENLPPEIQAIPRFQTILGKPDTELHRYVIKFRMKVQRPLGNLTMYLTDEELEFSKVTIDTTFPMEYESMKQVGHFEALGGYKENDAVEKEMMFYWLRGPYIRKLQGYILDAAYHVLVKMKINLILNEELDTSGSLVTASILERVSRIEQINKRLELPSSHPLQRLRHFSELATLLNRQKPEFIEASDQTKLAYRVYFPEKEYEAIVIEVSGNSFCYDIAALQVTNEYPIVYVIYEMRGYGHSGGARGTTPSHEQSLNDIKRIVRHFRLNYPGLPIFLLGASRVAALVLNYDGYKDKEPVEGYLFFNPNFGYNVKHTWDQEKAEKMHELMNVKVYRTNLFWTCLSEGWLKKDTIGIRINLDDEVYEKNPLFVNEFSTNLVFVLSAPNPKKQLAELNVPFGIWITKDDSLMKSDKVIQLAEKARPDLAELVIVDESAFHWEHFCWSARYLGPWVRKRAYASNVTVIDHPIRNSWNLTSLQLNVDELKHPVWKNFHETIQLTIDLKISEQPSKFFQSFDGTEIAYKAFIPKEGKSIANLGK
jgi:acylglycerol lipase